MFPGYSKFCLWLEEKGLDINSAFMPAIYTVMLMVAVFSLQYTHNTGKDCWDVVVVAFIFCFILIFVWFNFFCGHTCIRVKKVKDYRVDVRAVKQKIGECGSSTYEFRTAFNGTDEELKYIVDYARSVADRIYQQEHELATNILEEYAQTNAREYFACAVEAYLLDEEGRYIFHRELPLTYNLVEDVLAHYSSTVK